jgi:parvulin-like peptidyl-prolyl isomerase
MRNSNVGKLRLTACVLLGAAAIRGAESESVLHGPAVVALVNGTPITFGEVWKRIRLRLEKARTVLHEEQFQEYARRQLALARLDLIQKQLLLAKAKEESIEVNDKQVDRYAEREMEFWNEQEGENLTSLQDYWRAATESTGFTEKEYREELRARVAIYQLVHELVWKPEYFAPEVVRRYYDEHQADFRAGGFVTVRHIYIQRERPDYRDVVEKVAAALEKEDFEKVARDLVTRGYSRRAGSDGAGLCRFLLDKNEGDGAEQGEADGFLEDLLNPLPQVIRSLGEGERSPPLQTQQGTHFVKVIERGGWRVRSFSEVQVAIQRALSRDLEEKSRQDFFGKLARKAEVKLLPFPEETPLGSIPGAGEREPAGKPDEEGEG